MAQMMEETGSLDSDTLKIYRTAATVKGGRRFSFGALVIVGDRKGRVGFGYGKSVEVPQAIEKAEKYAKRNLAKIPMAGKTLPHEVEGRFSSSIVRLVPASPGTGVVAGGTVRKILELAGITDCLTKSYGSNNQLNLVRAIFDGIDKLRLREDVADLRGVEIDSTDIEERIKRGQRFMPEPSTTGEKMRGPVNTIGQDRGRGGGRGGRGGGRGGRGGGRGGFGGGPRGGDAPAAPAAEAPASGPAEGGEAPKPAES